MADKIPIFISYAHKDEASLKTLLLCLDDLRKDVEIWCDHYINPGDKWDATIKSALDNAEIVIFLLTEHFVQSEYINKIEVARVLRKEQCKIISIVATPVDFDYNNTLGQYQALPPLAKP